MGENPIVSSAAYSAKRMARLLLLGPGSLIKLARLPRSSDVTWLIGRQFGSFSALPLLCETRLPWSRIEAQLFDGRCAPVEQTPHFSFVMARLEGKPRHPGYVDYLVRHYGRGHDIGAMVTTFEKMIDDERDLRRDRQVLVRLTRAGTAVILDGAHRCSIMRAVGGRSDVACAICVCEGPGFRFGNG